MRLFSSFPSTHIPYQIMLRFLSGKLKPVNDYFNVWDHTLPEIYGIILAMFVKLDLVKCLNITEGELLDFIIDVDRGYLATYYHSFFHAADVTAVLYHILLDMNASQYLSKPDMAALLLAGLCHDIGHVSPLAFTLSIVQLLLSPSIWSTSSLPVLLKHFPFSSPRSSSLPFSTPSSLDSTTSSR